jgi:anthranilate synthase/aminodeoxychorismate synthase-like glutamine amidotransferase
MRLLVIDNYDSFTYNLVQYLGELGAELDVVRNDAAPLDELVARAPRGVVISPGPGRPEDAGVTVPAVAAFGGRGVPLLGVCLGHQAIGEAFGGRVVRARTLMHGKTSRILHDGRGVFEGLPDGFEATRYHSLVVEAATFPEALEVAARSPDGEIMGLRHRSLPIHGVQFHPESILTGEGKRLLGNFLALCARSAP